ncbi:hypothetical protein DPMN_054829 [Dreissena polymorpha]|uniref:Uncharacterized protein n=1 Tax=Dreissena polymorpha TaxID=45954 RepID=A0A9D4CPM0_DREPO|nr:hypothetical protein DPMN_054829 [Dreissena polymorpha]
MKECGESSICNKRIFVYHIPHVFSNAVKKRIKGKTTMTTYTGISVKKLSDVFDRKSLPENPQEIMKLLPIDVEKIEILNDSVKCSIPTKIFCDGNEVYKVIQFQCNGHWKLKISGTDIDLKSLFMNDCFNANKESVQTVIQGVHLLKLCAGVQISKTVFMSRYHTLNKWTFDHDNDNGSRLIHSVVCNRLVGMNSVSGTCKKCLK